jgi:hypothetical protein
MAWRRDWILFIFGCGGPYIHFSGTSLLAAHEIRKGRVIMIFEVKPLLVPPLVGRNPLHWDVHIGPRITELECTAIVIH